MVLYGQFLQYVLRPALTNPPARLSASSKTKSSLDPTQNKILGAARLRQLRVRTDSCTDKVHPEFSQYKLDCYGDYTPENEDNKRPTYATLSTDTFTSHARDVCSYTERT